jgi:hypothetical protein
VKYCFYLILCASPFAGNVAAQSTSVLLTPDLNGRSVESAAYVAKDGDRTELTQSINGRLVPLEKSDIHILSEGPNGKTTETIVRKYDATGQLASTERTVSVEQKTPSGSVINATIYRSDLNGSLQEAERRTIESQTQGPTTTTDVAISRAGLNGSFQVAEKRNIVTVANKDAGSIQETEVVQRPDQNGQLAEANREVREETKTADKVTSNTARYEPDYTGKMNLIRQQVETTAKSPDGSIVTERNTFAPSIYGVARNPDGAPKLQEQEIIVRRENNGVVTEKTTVSRPTLQDPNRLGPAAPVSELVCTGKCANPLPSPKQSPAEN